MEEIDFFDKFGRKIERGFYRRIEEEDVVYVFESPGYGPLGLATSRPNWNITRISLKNNSVKDMQIGESEAKEFAKIRAYYDANKDVLKKYQEFRSLKEKAQRCAGELTHILSTYFLAEFS